MTSARQLTVAALLTAGVTMAPLISAAHSEGDSAKAQASASASLAQYGDDVKCTGAGDGTAVPPKPTLSARASSKCDTPALTPQGTDAGTIAPPADRLDGADMPNGTAAGNSTPGGVTTANPADPANVGTYDYGRYSSSSSSTGNVAPKPGGGASA